jgi:hypothetical protein
MKHSIKTIILAFILAILFASCESQRHLVRVAQQEIQYEHSRSAGHDPGRMYRNWNNRPHRKTRIPIINIYIY